MRCNKTTGNRYRLHGLVQGTWISALPFSLNTPANAPATEFGLDFVETFSTSILRPPIEYITV